MALLWHAPVAHVDTLRAPKASPAKPAVWRSDPSVSIRPFADRFSTWMAWPLLSAARSTKAIRSAYEPFGGVYAREYALRRGSPLKPEQSWLFFPALALALTVAWQVFHNWTHSLIALLILSFLVQCYMPEWEDYGILFADSLQAPASGHRLVACLFLHTSWSHLAVNVYCLWFLGRLAERLMGPGRFLFAFLMAGIGGSFASLLWKRRRRDPAGSAGASGSILGMLGVLLVLRTRQHLPCDELWLSALLSLGQGFISREIDLAAHVGGALSGALVAYLWGPRYVWSWGGLLLRSAAIVNWPFV